MKPAESDDPMAMVGVLGPNDRSLRLDMARCLIDEFARDGMPAERIEALFSNPFYGIAHELWRELGESVVRGLVHEGVARWRRA